MPAFLLLMHNDTTAEESGAMWESYLATLRSKGAFAGGSSIGTGECIRKAGDPTPVARHLTGYARVEAADLAAARALVEGNPVYECGGTVEIRELTED